MNTETAIDAYIESYLADWHEYMQEDWENVGDQKFLALEDSATARHMDLVTFPDDEEEETRTTFDLIIYITDKAYLVSELPERAKSKWVKHMCSGPEYREFGVCHYALAYALKLGRNHREGIQMRPGTSRRTLGLREAGSGRAHMGPGMQL